MKQILLIGTRDMEDGGYYGAICLSLDKDYETFAEAFDALQAVFKTPEFFLWAVADTEDTFNEGATQVQEYRLESVAYENFGCLMEFRGLSDDALYISQKSIAFFPLLA